MRSLRRFAFAALIASAAVAVSMAAAPAEAAAATTQTRQAPTAQSLQADITRLTNLQRTAHGCRAATVNARLVTAAAGHSGWMARTGTFSHAGPGRATFVTRARAAGFTRPAGENIAWGYRSAAEVVNAWMRSPGHRANILNCRSTAVGVGAAVNAGGDAYYTQVFGY